MIVMLFVLNDYKYSLRDVGVGGYRVTSTYSRGLGEGGHFNISDFAFLKVRRENFINQKKLRKKNVAKKKNSTNDGKNIYIPPLITSIE